MSVEQLAPLEVPCAPAEAEAEGREITTRLPDLQEIPLFVRQIAAFRGLGFSYRQIARNYGVTPQAVSLMVSRHKALLKANRKNRSELKGLSPRAINCLGRLRISSAAAAREYPGLAAELRSQRNCGKKTVREILDWAGI